MTLRPVSMKFLGIVAVAISLTFSFLQTAVAEMQNFAKIVEPLLPSVVNISTSAEMKKDRRLDLFQQVPPGSPLEEFFRQFMEENPILPGRKTTSLGSGFIVAHEGETVYIVTCNHVIADADEIKVTLHNQKEYKAHVLGRDRRTDIAVLTIKSKEPLTIIKWGESDKVKVGEWLIAIGNPFGLSSTVTAGIVSTIARDIGASPQLGSADYVYGYIQTDASINMGSSGGPMFNIDGEVIAVSRVIFSPNGGNIGIGFGIPARLVIKVVEQLKKFGRTKRGWIGVHIDDITADTAEELGIKDMKRGALVANITHGGPSEKAGLKKGDIIRKFNDIEVKDSRHIQQLVGDSDIGAKVNINAWRSGKEVALTLQIGEFEKAEEQGLIATHEKPGQRKLKEKSEVILGLITQDITSSVRENYGLLPSVSKGVVVTLVVPDSDADSKGIRAGDVIEAYISEGVRTPINSSQELKNLVANQKKKGLSKVTLVMTRGENIRYITLDIDAEEPAERGPAEQG